MSIDLDTSLLLATLCAALMVLGFWHGKSDAFDLRHLLVDTDHGKVSLGKTGQFVALIVSTWALVHETRAGHLTEWLFGAYMIAWSGANIARMALEKKQEQK